MRLRTWFFSAMSAALAVTGSQIATAQQGPQYLQPGYQAPGYHDTSYEQTPAPQMVSVSATSLTSLIERIEALEASAKLAADEAEKSGGLKEIEILTKPTQKWTGRVHFDYSPFPDNSPLANFLETGDPNDGADDFIGFRRLRFGTAGDVGETMRYKIEMDFASPSNLAFKDAYLGWDELPILQTVLLGNQKRPYGLDHLNSSRYNVFMERPLVVEAFNQDARRIGIQSYGVSDNLAWNWRYGAFIMDNLQNVGFQRRDNYQTEVAGRLANTIWYDETSGGRGYAHWAVSGTAAMPGRGPDARFRTRPEIRTSNRFFDTGNLDAHTYQLLGLEGVVNVGAFSLVGEYQTVQVQRDSASEVNFGGGYFYAAYWLTGEHTPWDRESGTIGRTKPFENFFLVRNCDGSLSHGWGAWQVAGRYSHGDFSDDNINGGVGNTFSFGLNWWWNPNARVQFNYLYGDISQRVVTGAPATEGWYNFFGTRFMVDF